MNYQNCTLCPRRCGADRTAGKTGFCGMTDQMKIARAAAHYWEEPVISGSFGSGAVFFSGCTLGCAFCQNEEISHGGFGKEITSSQLRDIFERLIDDGVQNINLITATHFLPTILPALTPKLPVPVVYNCGGYESVETLKRLEGLVDIYLPDMKYADADLAVRLSGARDYFPAAKAAIKEMIRQTGPVRFDGERLLSGTVIRHLILPGCVENSLKVLDWIGETFAPGQVLVSLMRQYTPMGGLPAPFNRPITEEEYDAALSWMYLNGLEGFTQEESSAGRQYIPDF